MKMKKKYYYFSKQEKIIVTINIIDQIIQIYNNSATKTNYPGNWTSIGLITSGKLNPVISELIKSKMESLI